MTLDLRRRLRNLFRLARLSAGGTPSYVEAGDGEPQPDGDYEDIDGVLETFRGLITQLSHDGKEIGEICARAGKKAARYALLSEAVIESATSGILVIDKTDRVLLANSAAKRILDIGVETNVTGMDLAAMFKDGREFTGLASRCAQTGTNASRKISEVVTLAGKKRRLGVSASCIGETPPSVEAVMMIFASLGDAGDYAAAVDDDYETLEGQSYSRGVLDSYDLVSGLAADFARVEDKSGRGTLTASELRDVSRSVRRTCDAMMAFALSLGIADSIPELVDVNGLLGSIVGKLHLEGDTRLIRRLSDGLPHVKTIRKVLDVGLSLLIRGCLDKSPQGIEVGTGRDTSASVTIGIKELGRSKPISRVANSLREFTGGDTEREAALFILSKLPRESHRIQAGHVGGIFHFSMRVGSPIDMETGHGDRLGDSSYRGEDESR